MESILSQTKKSLLKLRNLIFRIRRLDREALASVYLRGSGIEIGALSSPLKVPSSAKVRYLDRMSVADLRKQYPEVKSYPLRVDIIDDGETLGAIVNNSQDFVIANHFLEHCQDPIRTVVNFIRVLNDGGIMFISLPDKRYMFDKKREVTSFDHLVRDHDEGPEQSRIEHLRDWVINVEQIRDEEQIQHKVDELSKKGYSLHYHVWTQREMFFFFDQMKDRFRLPLEILLFMKHEAEVIFIIKKQAP